jgi:hypothetical protein
MNGCCADGSVVCTVPATGGQPNINGYKSCNCASDQAATKLVRRLHSPSSRQRGSRRKRFPARMVKYARPTTSTYKWLGCRLARSDEARLVDATRHRKLLLGLVCPQDRRRACSPVVRLRPNAQRSTVSVSKPLTGETWGIWVAASRTQCNAGAWNAATDDPNGYKLKVGLGPIPQEYDYIIDARLDPTTLGGLVATYCCDSRLVCSNPAQQTSTRGQPGI